MGLHGSKLTEKDLPKEKIVQLVMDQMNKDPGGRTGQVAMKQEIALRMGYHLKK